MIDVRLLKAVPVLLTPIMFALSYIITALAAQRSDALFKNKIGNLSRKYYQEITPSGWTFSIWLLIYLWQAAWTIYGFCTIFINGINGKLYDHPEIIPILLYPIYMLNLMLLVMWRIFWDKEWLVASFLDIALLPITGDICIALSIKRINELYFTLSWHGLVKHVWLVRFLVQNGLATYTTWVTIATLLNFGVVLAYEGGVDQKNSSTICLCLLTLIIIAWFLLDILLLDKWVRYLFMPYFVVVVGLIGSLDKNYVAGARNSIFTVIILIIASLQLISKIAVLIYRHLRYPESTEMWLRSLNNANARGWETFLEEEPT